MSSPKRLLFLIALALLAGLPVLTRAAAKESRPPNIVVLFVDDLGYGDLSCYGHPTIRTPNLDRMAAEGMRFTDFYASAPVCTPSRAGLLTGRYAVRSGMASEKRRVLFPNSTGGLPASEITLAEALKGKGYATACIGKWHLGSQPQYLPTRNGFDYYFGLPYSNDMDHVTGTGPSGSLMPKVEWFNVPLLRNETVIERPAEQHTLTQRYTEEALGFMRRSKEKPFFLYLPYTMVHVPLFVSKEYSGKSRRGLYGDTLEEIDGSVGRILEGLRKEGLAKNTLVFFTSDNGPWLIQKLAGGSAGVLREGKGSTWEGGQREPALAWWPGKIKPNQVSGALASTLDLFPTALALAGAEMPADRPIDGVDLRPLLFGTGPGKRDTFFYYRDDTVYAARKGRYKAHFTTKSAYGKDPAEPHNPPLLFDLEQDPGEQFDVAAQHPGVVADLTREVEKHRATVTPVPNQLDGIATK
jgi:arylsulfatase A-like enzyme